MGKYNIFDDKISPKAKPAFDEEFAQTKALLDASNLISQAMNELNINQTQLAEKLDVSRGYVSRLLSGYENMSIKNVAGVLHALGKQLVLVASNENREVENSNIYDFERYTVTKFVFHVATPVVQGAGNAAPEWEFKCDTKRIG
jgi:transcriptional regulator with XRE-family HTH domain